MNQTKKIICLSAAMALAGCTADTLVEEGVKDTPVSQVRFVHACTEKKSQSVVVKFRPQVIEQVERSVSVSRSHGVSRSGLSPFDTFLSRSEAISFKRVFPVGKYEKRTRKSGLHLWYEVVFDSSVENAFIEEELKQVNDLQVVEFPVEIKSIDPQSEEKLLPQVEPTQSNLNVQYPVNDPYLPKQWNYHNDGSYPEGAVPTADINLFKAWEKCMGHPDVIVAVIDQAVSYNHPDLKENMWVNEAEKNGQQGVDDDQNGYVDDIYGYNFRYNTSLSNTNFHGTHVAGTISAVNNNGIGVCGIAGGSGKGDGVKIMSCQIIDESLNTARPDSYTDAKAVKYAADNGAVISQNSWGYETDAAWWGDGMDMTMSREAYQYFIDYAGIDENGKTVGPIRGGVVLFCAGNEGIKYRGMKIWPSAYSPFVAVSAIGCDFRPSYYTDYGNWVDVAAPGGDQKFDPAAIWSTGTTGNVNGYKEMQGTSMACPHASGVAALIASYAHQNHFELTGSQVAQILVASTRNIDSHFKGTKESKGTAMDSGFKLKMEDYKGLMGGLLDASRALEMVDEVMGRPASHVAPMTPEVPNLKSAGPDFLELQWKVGTDCQGSPLKGYNVYFSEDPILIDRGAVQMTKELEGPVFVSTESLKAGDMASVHIPRMEYETMYYFAVVGIDQWRMESEPVTAEFQTSFDSWGEPVADLQMIHNTDHSLTLQWKETKDGKGRPYHHYKVEYAAPNKTAQQVEVASSGKVGNVCQVVLDKLRSYTSYDISVIGYDEDGVMCRPKEITAQTKHEFSMEPLFKLPLVLEYWEDTTLYYKVNQGEATSWSARIIQNDDMWSLTTDRSNVMLRFHGPVKQSGKGNIRIVLTDNLGNEASTVLEYFIVSNKVPGLKKQISDCSIRKLQEKLMLNLEDYFADANNEPLTFDVTQVGDAVEMSVEKGVLTCQAVKNGTSQMKIQCTDMGGQSVSASFKIDVFEMPEGTDMLLYPNPVKDVLKIRLLDEVVGKVSVSVFNAAGQALLHTQEEVESGQPLLLNAASLDAGYLFVEVKYQDKIYKGNVIKL